METHTSVETEKDDVTVYHVKSGNVNIDCTFHGPYASAACEKSNELR